MTFMKISVENSFKFKMRITCLVSISLKIRKLSSKQQAESFTVKKIILQLNPLWRTAVHKLSSRRVYLWGVGLFFSGWVYQCHMKSHLNPERSFSWIDCQTKQTTQAYQLLAPSWKSNKWICKFLKEYLCNGLIRNLNTIHVSHLPWC